MSKACFGEGSWVAPGDARALCWLLIDDQKGNFRRQALPSSVYRDSIAPFLRFSAPLEDQLYVIGGRNEDDGPLSTVEMFDFWRGQWVDCPNMGARRGGCAGTTLPDGRLFVGGGYDERGFIDGILASWEAFDPRTNRWSSDISPMNVARWGHACASLRGKTYVVGGCSLVPHAPARDDFMQTLRSCEIYDPAQDRWSLGPDLCVARGGTRLVVVDDRHLVAVGGCDDVFGRADMLATVELLEASVGQWVLFASCLSVPRTAAAVAQLDDNSLLVVGGACADDTSYVASSEVYQLPSWLTGCCNDEASAASWSTASPGSASSRRPPSSMSSSSSSSSLGALTSSAAPAPTSTAHSSSWHGPTVAGSGLSVIRARASGVLNDYAAVTEQVAQEIAPEVARLQDIAGRASCQTCPPDGRMGCQAIAVDLPAPGKNFPSRTRRSILVVGGEKEAEEDEPPEQFSSILVYDAVESVWRPEHSFAPMKTARTAMALCVGPGRAST
eukprot:TRINITY_DN9953_c0_g4_i1.p1 TRINITY_DN9953_c0_g4~~TRINITY_DN9953_c0_g4_i1.p1  ORF type:complete len:500 (-),score=80.12 TRINITY_DN9953_c0_g4_i1:126-1625(-)